MVSFCDRLIKIYYKGHFQELRDTFFSKFLHISYGEHHQEPTSMIHGSNFISEYCSGNHA